MKKPTNQIPKLFMKLNSVKYGKGLKLYGMPFIYRFKKASIEIGNKVTINSSFISNLLGVNHRTILVARYKGKISIGNNCGISATTIYSWDKIEIGDGTIIGVNTKIMDTDFHPVDPEARAKHDNKAIKTKPVKIGKNVFIGCNSLILKGTVIGDNCTVGAGSVVSGEFPDNCIIAGNPARIIKNLKGDD